MIPARWAASRRRVAAYFAAFGLASLLPGLFLVYLLVLHLETRLAYQLAEQRADEMVKFAQPPAEQRSRLDVLPAQDRERFDELDAGHHLMAGEREIIHVVVRLVDGRRHVATYGDALHRERIVRMGRMLLAVGAALGAAIVVLAGWWSGVMIRLRPSVERRAARASAPAGAPGPAGDPRSELALPYNEYQHGVLGTRQGEREFIANIGHELRTPITLVLTGCELLRESERLGEPERRQIARIANAAEHMSELVRSFLVLARDGDFGGTEMVEVRQCVLESLSPHWDELKRAGIQVRIHIGAEVAVHANREAVFVVINNLVKNAIKYTDRGGITLHYLGHSLYVTDTGCGIDEQDLSRIFTPFFRSRSAAESGRAGLGLGLAIVKRICDFYRWPIQFRSSPGVGTTVRVDFTHTASLFR